jgi:hypothetical protein
MRKSAVALLLCILMLATTTAGCIQAFSSSSPPVPAMSITPSGSIRADSTITFDASASSDLDGDILNYSWKFGDGAVADGVEVTHSYSKLGEYTVVLSVGDGQYEATMEARLGLAANLTIRNATQRNTSPRGPGTSTFTPTPMMTVNWRMTTMRAVVRTSGRRDLGGSGKLGL